MPFTELPATILVVDDEQDLRKLLVRVLEVEGFAVREAPDAQGALKILQSNVREKEAPIDLVLLDVALPDMNGMTLFARMRADERIRQIPVIFLTGDAEYHQKARAFEAGAADYITKPFQRKDLVLRIRAQIRDKRQRQEEKETATGIATQAQLSLSEAEQRFSALMRNSFHLVCELDQNLNIVYASPNHQEILATSPENLLGQAWPAALHPDERDEIISSFLEIFSTGAEKRLLIEFRDGANHWRWLDTCGSILKAGSGDSRLLLVSRDITHSKETERYLQHLALHDSLTGLANRERFTNEIEKIVDEYPNGAPYAVMYIDLDNFKLINDRHGHPVGDQVLRTMGELFKRALPNAQLLARFGGDEFCILIEAKDQKEAEALAGHLCEKAGRTPVLASAKRHRITLSIGVAQIEANLGVTEVLSRANTALHVAKSHGKNRYCLYESDSAELLNLQKGAEWFQKIQEGLEESRFEAWYQPLVDLKTGRVADYEALIRYRDPQGVLHSPAAFLSSAERYNLMPQVDRYMVGRILRQVAPLSGIDVAINLSGDSIIESNIAAYIIQCFDEIGVDPKRITFEITETVFMTNLPQARSIVESLQELGCRFALDDFGAGFSSLNYLRHLPVNTVKVDGSFVREAHSDPVSRTLLKSINEIAHLLGKQTVAEWVENQETYELLREIGFDYAQGYYSGKPVPSQSLPSVTASSPSESALSH